MTTPYARQLVPLDDKGRAVILFTFECQTKGFGLCGYNMLNRIIAPKDGSRWQTGPKSWWARNMNEDELDRIPDHWSGKVLLWNLRDKRNGTWHLPCYDTATRSIKWLLLSTRFGLEYATPVQFVDPAVQINMPVLGKPADQNWCHPVPRKDH